MLITCLHPTGRSASRFAGEHQPRWCCGVDRGLHSRRDAIDGQAIIEVVAERRVNLPSQPDIQSKVVPDLPLVLYIAVILLRGRVDSVSAALGVAIWESQEEVSSSVPRAERTSGAKGEVAVVVGREGIEDVVAAHLESRLQAVLADDLRKIVGELIILHDSRLRAVSAEAQSEEAGHSDEWCTCSG